MEETGEYKVIDKRMKEEMAVEPAGDNFLAIVERLSMRPDIPVEKIKQLMEMQEHVLDRNAKQAFNAAMVRAQSKIKVIPTTSKNTQTNSMYAKHEDIVRLAAPIYTDEGFSLSFYEEDSPKEGHLRVMCDVMHDQGHTKTYHLDTALDMTGIKGTTNKTLIHAEGSSFTYGKRRLTCLIFNIPTGDDDDGNLGGGSIVEYITEKQVSELTDMINDTKTDETKFLAYIGTSLKREVDSIQNIPVKGYQIALAALKAKAKKKSREPGEDG